MTQPSIYGQGLAFPPRVGPDGRLAWSAGEDNVREAIRLILLTEPGERLMREAFGCGLRQYLFEPNTPVTRQLIAERIDAALQQLEPRITVAQVTADTDPNDPTLIAVTINFTLVATGVPGRLGLTLQLEG
jgi:phage baseplate assembly protein W